MDLLGQVQRAQRLAYRLELVLVVVDHEVPGQAGRRRLPAEDAHAQAVEGRDPALHGRAGEQRLRARLHLPRRLVGEGDGQDALRGHPLVEDEVGDPMGDDAGLAAPGAGEDEDGPLARQHRLPLLRVQPREQWGLLDRGFSRVGIAQRNQRRDRRERAEIAEGPGRLKDTSDSNLCGLCVSSAASAFQSYSTVTDLARLRGWSTSRPARTAV